MDFSGFEFQDINDDLYILSTTIIVSIYPVNFFLY